LQKEPGHVTKLVEDAVAQVRVRCHRLCVQQDNERNIFGGFLDPITRYTALGFVLRRIIKARARMISAAR
jgi:hypothetical protein